MEKQELSVKTKPFMAGNSQAIRLPKGFRVESEEVVITKREDGTLIITEQRSSFKDFFEARDRILDGEEITLEREHLPARERDIF